MDRNEPAQLLGLASASLAGSFVSVPTAISLIFDSCVVEWNNGGAEPAHMPSTNFALLASPAARGRSVEVQLSGFAQAPRLRHGGIDRRRGTHHRAADRRDFLDAGLRPR